MISKMKNITKEAKNMIKKSTSICIGTLLIATVFASLFVGSAVADDSPPYVKWSYADPKGCYAASMYPVIADGKIYYGTEEAIGIGLKSRIICLSEDGDHIWHYDVHEDIGDRVTTPVVDNGKVYFGTETDDIEPCSLYCRDAATGEYIWTAYTGGKGIPGAPVVHNGNIYLGTKNGKVSSLNANDGSLNWMHETESGSKIMGVAVNDENVFFGSLDGKLYSLYADTGDPKWEFPPDEYPSYGIYTAPVISDGKVYYTSYNGILHCLDAESGEEDWNRHLEGYEPTFPIIVDDKIYVGIGVNIYCLNIDDEGSDEWITSVDANIVGIDYEDGRIYATHHGIPVISSSGSPIYIACVDDDSTINWDFNMGFSSSLSYPIVDGRDAYVLYQDRAKCISDEDTPPFTPGTPIGIIFGMEDIEYTYSTNPVIDPDGDDVTYQFDWGDEIGEWVDTPVDSHIWVDGGDYDVRVRAKGIELCSEWSNPLNVHINRVPDKPNNLDGPTDGIVNVEYTYTIKDDVADPDGDDIYYVVDWGDGEDTVDGPHDSGDEVLLVFAHTWQEAGVMHVTVTAKDQFDGLSEPTEMIVNICRIDASISGGFGSSIALENLGPVGKNVEWNVDIMGGRLSFFQVNRHYNGTIFVDSHETEVVEIPPFRIFGRFTITVETECIGDITTEITTEKGFGLFIYTLIPSPI